VHNITFDLQGNVQLIGNARSQVAHTVVGSTGSVAFNIQPATGYNAMLYLSGGPSTLSGNITFGSFFTSSEISFQGTFGLYAYTGSPNAGEYYFSAHGQVIGGTKSFDGLQGGIALTGKSSVDFTNGKGGGLINLSVFGVV